MGEDFRSGQAAPMGQPLVRDRVGLNEPTLECDYAENHSGLEIVCLLGSFGTAVNGTEVAITALPAHGRARVDRAGGMISPADTLMSWTRLPGCAVPGHV